MVAVGRVPSIGFKAEEACLPYIFQGKHCQLGNGRIQKRTMKDSRLVREWVKRALRMLPANETLRQTRNECFLSLSLSPRATFDPPRINNRRFPLSLKKRSYAIVSLYARSLAFLDLEQTIQPTNRARAFPFFRNT